MRNIIHQNSLGMGQSDFSVSYWVIPRKTSVRVSSEANRDIRVTKSSPTPFDGCRRLRLRQKGAQWENLEVARDDPPGFFVKSQQHHAFFSWVRMTYTRNAQYCCLQQRSKLKSECSGRRLSPDSTYLHSVDTGAVRGFGAYTRTRAPFVAFLCVLRQHMLSQRPCDNTLSIFASYSTLLHIQDALFWQSPGQFYRVGTLLFP